MMPAVGVFLAGGLGAACRAGLDAVVTRRWRAHVSGASAKFPAGTFVVNVSGSFLLGLVTGYAAAHTAGAVQDFATVAGVGFLGGYTTFSTAQWHTLNLSRGNAKVAAWDVLVSVVASLLLAAAGLWLGGRLG
jgi:CrcB protein